APAWRSVPQLPGSIYPTLTSNAGPAKARNCRQNPAEGGGNGTVLLKPSSEQVSAGFTEDRGKVPAVALDSFGAGCEEDSFIEAPEVSRNLIIDKLKLTVTSVNRNLGIRWSEAHNNSHWPGSNMR